MYTYSWCASTKEEERRLKKVVWELTVWNKNSVSINTCRLVLGIKWVVICNNLEQYLAHNKHPVSTSYFINNIIVGFPGGAVVESLPANAGDTGSSPGLGRSHMPRSNWDREPQLLSLRVWSLCSATREAAIVRGPHTTMKSGPARHN